jgi:hypothetical protein
VTHSVDQAIANNTLTDLAFNTTIFDDDGMHSTSVNNNRLTCRVAGRYLLTANTAWVQNNTGYRVTEFLLNGGGFFGGSSAPATSSATVNESSRQSFSAFVEMVVGDYVTCAVKQGSGGSLSIFSFLIPTGITPTFGALRMG